jgi:hypothetical protein
MGRIYEGAVCAVSTAQRNEEEQNNQLPKTNGVNIHITSSWPTLRQSSKARKFSQPKGNFSFEN